MSRHDILAAMVKDSASPRAEGALNALRDALDRLHFAADKLSLRNIAKRTDGSDRPIRHATVGLVLRCEKLPVWHTLKVVVEALGGDVDEFRLLWRDAAGASQREDVVDEFCRIDISPEEAESVDYLLSQRFGCNDDVAEAASYEGIKARQLCVGSTVELASKWAGWTRADVRTRQDGGFVSEPEVVELIGESSQGGDNWSLASFKEDLSDERGLELRFKRIDYSHVRAVANSFDAIYGRLSQQRRFLFERSELSYAHSVVVQMALVTEDGYLVLGHRSSRPRFCENTWSATFEEHMKPSEDGTDPFASALRGLREELVGRGKLAVTVDDVRLFSVFREFYVWENSEQRLPFWNVNVGVSGKVTVPCTVDAVFRNWRQAEDKAEFRHLVGIPYNFDNVWRLINSHSFEPAIFDGLKVPVGADPTFPNLATRPLWRRQHPTNQIRLIRCLSADFTDQLRQRLDTTRDKAVR